VVGVGMSSISLFSLPLLNIIVPDGVVGIILLKLEGNPLALSGLFFFATFPVLIVSKGFLSVYALRHCSIKSFGTLSSFSFLYSFACSNIDSS